MRQVLADSLTRSQRNNAQLTQKLEGFRASKPEKIHATVSASLFWTIPPNALSGITCAPELDKALMFSLGLGLEYEALDPEGVNELMFERKVDEIRGALPAYPPIPDRNAPRLPPISPQQPSTLQIKPGRSKIPQSKIVTSAHVPPPNPSPLQVPAHPPNTPSLSPSRWSHSTKRKSVRFSTARRRTGRPSIFHLFSGPLEDEVDRVCLAFVTLFDRK
jgi:hypothetical protein